VVRNTLQYERLYDDNGQFRPEVGTRAIHRSSDAGGTSIDAPATQQPVDETVIQRRFSGTEHGE
jgi:hypothetical protein